MSPSEKQASGSSCLLRGRRVVGWGGIQGADVSGQPCVWPRGSAGQRSAGILQKYPLVHHSCEGFPLFGKLAFLSSTGSLTALGRCSRCRSQPGPGICSHTRGDGFLLLLSPSVVSDSAALWAVARQAPLSVGFPRIEHWTGEPFPPPGGWRVLDHGAPKRAQSRGCGSRASSVPRGLWTPP